MHYLLDCLKQLNIPIKLHEHEPIFTAEQGRHLVEKIPGIHCKNLFLIDDQTNYWLVSVPFTTRTDLKKLAALLQVKKLQFGSPADLEKYLGVTPGAVTPFALINDAGHKVTIILDNVLLKEGLINIHPLVNTITTSIHTQDLIKFIQSLAHKGLIIDFDDMKIVDFI